MSVTVPPRAATVQQERRHEGMGVMEAWADGGGAGHPGSNTARSSFTRSTMSPFDHTPGSARALGYTLSMSPGPALRASRQWDLKKKQLLAQRELDGKKEQETFLGEDSAQAKGSNHGWSGSYSSEPKVRCAEGTELGI